MGISFPGSSLAIKSRIVKNKRNAQDSSIVPISNAPLLKIPDEYDIPNEYQFEIFRLRRRVAELDMIVIDANEKISLALATVEHELLFWRTGLHLHVWESIGQLQRRVIRLETALSMLKVLSAKPVPQEIPERWRKGSPKK